MLFYVISIAKPDRLLTTLLIVLMLGATTPGQAIEATVYTEADGLGDRDVYALAVVGDTVWAGTARGLSWREPESSQWHNSLPPGGAGRSFITCLTPAGELMWVGTPQGLALFDIRSKRWKSVQFPAPLSQGYIASILVEPEQIWVGLWRDGLYRLDPSKGGAEHIPLPPEGAQNIYESVYALAASGDYLYVGTARGLLTYNRAQKQWRRISTADGLGSDLISAMAVDGENLWLGTAAGPARYNKQTGELSAWTATRLGAEFGKEGATLPNAASAGGCSKAVAFISTIVLDGDLVWLATFRKGTAVYDKTSGVWQSITTNFEGVRTKGVYALAACGDDVWLGSPEAYYGSGLTLVSKADLLAKPSGP